MATLKELLAQRAAIEKQIADAQRVEKGGAITQVRNLMAQYGLTMADLGNARPMPVAKKRGNVKGSKIAAKYRNPETGDAWSGRGLQPKWLKAALADGRSLTDFAV